MKKRKTKSKAKKPERELQLFNGAVELLTVEDITSRLNVSDQTLRRYIREGKLKARKVGRQYYITKENFIKYLNGETPDK
jgi:excisionase family DNA binding protein